jgi:protein-tyrosine phosphatase
MYSSLINKIDEIIPNLYLSNWDKSNDVYELEKNNIKAIITIETNFKSKNIINYYKNNNIDYYYLYLNDLPDENISQYFDDSFHFIKNHILNGNNVLVHCRVGVSRSATLVLNYIIRQYYLNRGDKNVKPEYVVDYAVKLVRSKRSIVNPNPGFIKQLILKAYEYRNGYFV